jgi:hypothetical protein
MSIDAIEQAIAIHQDWVIRFRCARASAATERIDPEAVRSDDACGFGHWLSANASRFSNPASFERALAMHRAFHEIAANIAVMINSDESPWTIDAYLVELESLSKQLVSYLRQIKFAVVSA